MLIPDVNTSGISTNVFTCIGARLQILIGGTWNGATVELQKQLSDASWLTVYSFTADDFKTVDVVGPSNFRTKTTVPGSAPVLKCDITQAL